MTDKEKALQTALANIEKQFGKGAVMRLGENVTMNVDKFFQVHFHWILLWA